MKTSTQVRGKATAARPPKQASRNSAKPPAETHQGDIKWIQRALGFGFISLTPELRAALKLKPDEDVMFNLGDEASAGQQQLKVGDKVSYTLKTTTREPITKAVNVTVLESTPVPAMTSTPMAKESDSAENAVYGFSQMKDAVYRVLALLELFSKPMAMLLDSKQAAGLGCLELANDCAKALFKDWQEACEESRKLRDHGTRTHMVNDSWPATFRLDVSVAEAVLLLDRFGNELEDEYIDAARRRAEREGGESDDRGGYVSMARRCGQDLRQSFMRAWHEWNALDKEVEQRQAAQPASAQRLAA